MSMRASLFGVAIALTFTAVNASAQQQMSWTNYCTLDANPLCSSIELDLVPENGWTDFTIRLRNLEGYFGMTPWALYNVTFNLATDLGPGGAVPSFQSTLSGSSDLLVTGSPAECANVAGMPGCPSISWGTMEWDWRVDTDGRAQFGSSSDWLPRPFGTVGCVAPPQPSVNYAGLGYFQTCGDGWVNFAFTIPGTWTFDDRSNVSIVTYDGTNFGSCTFGTTCQQVTSTPEPSTLVLMLTGMLAVAGVARRRRDRSPG